MGYPSNNKKYKLKTKAILAAILTAILLIGAAVLVITLLQKKDNGAGSVNSPVSQGSSAIEEVSSNQASSEEEKTVSVTLKSGDTVTVKLSELPAGSLSDWNLILLNPEAENKLDKELDVALLTRDGQKDDARAIAWFDKMNAAIKADGASADDSLYLRSGYRTIALQKTYYDYNVNMYLKQGKTPEEAKRLTLEYYTEPGHSEHHSGLAFDIITPRYQRDIHTLDTRFAETSAFKWLSEHAAEYGFILRYPADKEAVTQIKYEPWHYRYVGTEHAKFMKAHNLCFEEYISLLKAAGR